MDNPTLYANVCVKCKHVVAYNQATLMLRNWGTSETPDNLRYEGIYRYLCSNWSLTSPLTVFSGDEFKDSSDKMNNGQKCILSESLDKVILGHSTHILYFPME